MQLACDHLGGKVIQHPCPRVWPGDVHVSSNASACSRGFRRTIEVWMSHGDQVSKSRIDFVPLAKTAHLSGCRGEASELPVYGLQFHPEVTHTPHREDAAANFLATFAAADGTWQSG